MPAEDGHQGIPQRGRGKDGGIPLILMFDRKVLPAQGTPLRPDP